MIDTADILDTLGMIDMTGTADKVDTPDKADRIDIVGRVDKLGIVGFVDKVDLDLDTSVRKASVDPWCNPVHMHTDMLDHTPVCKPAVEIHNLAEVEVDIDLEDTHQMVDIDQQLEKAEGKGHIPNILVS